MIIRELPKHFSARVPEWVNCVTIGSWGTYAILHPLAFNEPGLAGFRALAPTNPASTWGLITLLMGLIQLTALIINGSYHRSPIWRLAMSLGSAAVWFTIVMCFWITGRPSFALVMYSSAVAINLISAYRATCDAVIADASWRAAGAGSRGKPSSYSSVGV